MSAARFVPGVVDICVPVLTTHRSEISPVVVGLQ